MEPAAEQLVEWLHLVSDTKGHHIRDLEVAVASQAQRGDALEAQLSDLETQLRDVQGKLTVERTAAERAAAEAAKMLADETARARDLEDAVASQAQRGDALEAQLSDLKTQLRDVQGHLTVERAAAERAAAEAAKKLADETARARDAETRAAEEMLAVEKRAAGLQEELEQLRASFAFTKEEFAKQRAYLESKIRSLEEDIRDATERARREQEQLENKLAEAQRESERRDAEMQEVRAKYKTLQRELHEAEKEKTKIKGEVESWTNQVRRMTDQNQKLQGDLDRQKETLLMQESQLRKATKEMEHALRVKREEEEKRAKMELRLEQLQQELTKMAVKYQSADEQVQELRTSVLQLEEDTENLRRSNTSLEESRAQLLITVETSEQANARFRGQIADAQASNVQLCAMKEDLESMVSGCRFEISRLEAAAEKQKGVMEEMRKRELDMQSLLQKREAAIKEATINIASEHQQSVSRDQLCQALRRELASLKEQLTTAEDMRSRAELRLKESEADRDRLLPDLERQKQIASSKAQQVGHLEHQHFQLESRVAELEKRLEWERKAATRLEENRQELLLHVNDLKERVGDAQRKACLYADNASALERELDKQRALAEHMCSSWRHSLRSAQRDATLEETLQRNGLLLSHRGTFAPERLQQPSAR